MVLKSHPPRTGRFKVERREKRHIVKTANQKKAGVAILVPELSFRQKDY